MLSSWRLNGRAGGRTSTPRSVPSGGRWKAGVETDTFQDVLTAAARLRIALQDRLERTSSDFLHMFNLPARSDIRHLSEQLNRLDKQVRDLKLELESQGDASSQTPRRK